MRVGSIVELIENIKHPPFPQETYPVKGVRYTVRTIEGSRWKCIRLEEIINPILPYLDGTDECMFAAHRFRELLPPETLSEEIKEALENEPVYI